MSLIPTYLKKVTNIIYLITGSTLCSSILELYMMNEKLSYFSIISGTRIFTVSFLLLIASLTKKIAYHLKMKYTTLHINEKLCFIYSPIILLVMMGSIYHLTIYFRGKNIGINEKAFYFVIITLFISIFVPVAIYYLIVISFKATSSIKKHLFFSLTLSLTVIIYSLILGDHTGKGLFGFISILKKEELPLKPFLIFFSIFITFEILDLLKKLTTITLLRYVTSAFFLYFLTLSLSLPFYYSNLIRKSNFDEGKSLIFKYEIGFLRKLTDRDKDGFSSLWGGEDCNDTDPKINPNGIEIPNNGIDEDCSGEDLKIDLTKKDNKKDNKSINYNFPKDLSLILITIEALRYDITGYMNYKRRLTPTIDYIASKGVVYKKAYALSSYTGGTIAPLLVGRYPIEMARNCDHFVKYFDKENLFVSERLKEEGIITAATHAHFYFFPNFKLNQGFTIWDIRAIPSSDEPWDSLLIEDTHIKYIIENLKELINSKERFFYWIHLTSPHKDYLKHEGVEWFGDTSRDRYDHEVLYTDTLIKKVIDVLEKTDTLNKTALIITGDHGEAFGEHRTYFHGQELWEEIVRTILVIYIPGVKHRIIERRVSHIDIAPTIYEIMNVKPKEELSGSSLLPELFGEELPEKEIYIFQPEGPYMPMMEAFIHNDIKLINRFSGKRYLLFDLKNDPLEKDDLSSSNLGLLQKMIEKLQQFKATKLKIYYPNCKK